jgi:hypothetical protein
MSAAIQVLCSPQFRFCVRRNSPSLSAATHVGTMSAAIKVLCPPQFRFCVRRNSGSVSAAIPVLCPPQLSCCVRRNLRTTRPPRSGSGSTCPAPLVDPHRSGSHLPAQIGLGSTCLPHMSTPPCRPPLVDPHLSTSRLSAAIHLCSSGTHLSDPDTHTSKTFVRRNSLMSGATRLYPP